MSLTQLLNRPVTITRRTPSGAKDGYGNELDDETTVTTVCELQQRQRDEQTDRGDIIDTTWVLFLPAGTVIDAGDMVTVDGTDFEVHGQPWPARNPRTETVSHIEATLRRTSGSGTAS